MLGAIVIGPHHSTKGIPPCVARPFLPLQPGHHAHHRGDRRPGSGNARRPSPAAASPCPGWAGKIDASEAGRGGKLEDAKLAKEGNDLHVTTGPAVAYWNPANKASGNYTVKATFTEAKYMNLNDHPHPYGIVIGGNDMGTDNQTLPVLRGVRQREVHRARLRAGAVPAQRSAATRTTRSTRPLARVSR